ncbi:MAG: histidine kinase dimerization/phospho-acceptor domain-containing protein, partial [Oleiharenicola lentus]
EEEEKRELAAAMDKLRLAQEQLKRQNQDLTVARASAEAANDAKDEFLASLSHELRTPLTPILMVAGALAADAKFPSEYRNYVSIIRRNAEMEARLIDGTQFWAVMTIDDATRRRFVCRLLEFIGCHDETVTQACAVLGLGDTGGFGFKRLSA